MKKLFFSLFIFVSSFAQAQYDNNWALGFRVGEPLGVNVRKYFSEGDKAFDINVGTYGFLYGRTRYYAKKKDPVYDGSGLMIQGLYSWHKNPVNINWLHLTYGFGGQINSRRIPLISRVDGNIKQVSLGPAAASGIEIKLPNNDIGIFLDAGGYVEILPRPFFSNLQISGGARLNLVR